MLEATKDRKVLSLERARGNHPRHSQQSDEGAHRKTILTGRVGFQPGFPAARGGDLPGLLRSRRAPGGGASGANTTGRVRCPAPAVIVASRPKGRRAAWGGGRLRRQTGHPARATSNSPACGRPANGCRRRSAGCRATCRAGLVCLLRCRAARRARCSTCSPGRVTGPRMLDAVQGGKGNNRLSVAKANYAAQRDLCDVQSVNDGEGRPLAFAVAPETGGPGCGRRPVCEQRGKRHPVPTPGKRCGKRHRPCGPGALNCEALQACSRRRAWRAN